MRKISTVILVFVFSVASNSKADDLKEFLLSCGYGTLIGATIGLGTVAFSDNPSGKISNIARGASLGLYFGIGMGLYAINKNKETYQSKSNPSAFLVPMFTPKKEIEGVQIHSVVLRF